MNENEKSGGRFVEEKVVEIVRAEERVRRLEAALKNSILTSNELRGRKVVERKKILGEWLREGDLGFIFAPRGRGKTWISMAVAKAISIGNGSRVGPWDAGEPQRTLYIDGEMNLDATQSREMSLRGDPEENLQFLHHAVIFEEAEESLNLTERHTQDIITGILMERKIRVLVMDNLSSLFYGIKENENDSWEAVLPWLLELRRRGITVIIVHHAGTNETRMRGATKREDSAHWVLRLDASPHGDPEEGARFATCFTKCRNCPHKDAPSVDFYFMPGSGLSEGKVEVTWTIVDALERFKVCIRDLDLETASDIADEMKSSKGYVSKLAKRAEREGWCRIQERRYSFIHGADEKKRDLFP